MRTLKTLSWGHRERCLDSFVIPKEIGGWYLGTPPSFTVCAVFVPVRIVAMLCSILYEDQVDQGAAHSYSRGVTIDDSCAIVPP